MSRYHSDGLGSPLPGVATPSITLIYYSSRTASPIIIYSSRTASCARIICTVGVATPGGGGQSPFGRLRSTGVGVSTRPFCFLIFSSSVFNVGLILHCRLCVNLRLLESHYAAFRILRFIRHSTLGRTMPQELVDYTSMYSTCNRILLTNWMS